MQFLDNLIIICMIVGSFLAGKAFADRYHFLAERDKQYALQKQYSRLLTGSDADDPVQPYKFQLPPEFEKRLKDNGRATMSVDNAR